MFLALMRPQTDPAQDGMTGLSLADVTARWKAATPQERLRRRGDLLRVADFLETAGAALDRALDLGLDADLGLDRVRDRARNLALDRALDPALDRALDLARDRAFAGDRALARDFIEAHGNLTDAANNFVGADLTTVNPAAVNLAGIRWDSDTQWPTPEWTARIHRASMEDPPGSGVFIVRPEQGHNFADRDSLAPIS